MTVTKIFMEDNKVWEEQYNNKRWSMRNVTLLTRVYLSIDRLLWWILCGDFIRRHQTEYENRRDEDHSLNSFTWHLAVDMPLQINHFHNIIMSDKPIQNQPFSQQSSSSSCFYCIKWHTSNKKTQKTKMQQEQAKSYLLTNRFRK